MTFKTLEAAIGTVPEETGLGGNGGGVGCDLGGSLLLLGSSKVSLEGGSTFFPRKPSLFEILEVVSD